MEERQVDHGGGMDGASRWSQVYLPSTRRLITIAQ